MLPPNVKDVLGKNHLVFFVHRVVERLDLEEFTQAYGEEGGALYAPELMLKVWLYAYALGVTSARRLEQRIREDLAFRYLAGGATPDNWALSAFRRRHERGINDVFTQVLELAQKLGDGAAGTCGHRFDAGARSGRAGSDGYGNQVTPGTGATAAADSALAKSLPRPRTRTKTRGCRCQVEELEQRLETIPGRLQRLRKSGLRQISRSDPESRFLRSREGWQLGYSAEIAVSEDHLIVAQRVTQNASDNASLLPLVDEASRQCRGKPQRVSADTGFFSLHNLHGLREREIDGYVPDANLSYELKGKGKVARDWQEQTSTRPGTSPDAAKTSRPGWPTNL